MQTQSTISLHALVAVATCFVAAACSDNGSSVNQTSTLDPLNATGGFESELPANTGAPTYVDTVVDRGCTYTVGYATQMPPFPPLYLPFVERSGNPHHCQPGFVVLGSSYAIPFVAIATGHGGLVADFTMKQTPSGEAHSQLIIIQLDPNTGDFVRRAVLAAMSPPSRPDQGNIFTGALRIEPTGTLVVEGDKNGIIPGEVGVGVHYIAVFDHFLHDKSDHPVPTSVVAFNAL